MSPQQTRRQRRAFPGAGAAMRSDGVLSESQLARLAINAGFGGRATSREPVNTAEVVNAVAIALAEHSGRVRLAAVANEPNGSKSFGPWMINSVHGYDQARLTSDAQYNADAAYEVFERAGHSFTPWSVFKSGKFVAYRRKAARGVKTAGYLKQGPIGGNLATDVDEAVSAFDLNSIAAAVWPVLMQGALAATGLALIGYGLVKLVSPKVSAAVKTVAPAAAAVGKAV